MGATEDDELLNSLRNSSIGVVLVLVLGDSSVAANAGDGELANEDDDAWAPCSPPARCLRLSLLFTLWTLFLHLSRIELNFISLNQLVLVLVVDDDTAADKFACDDCCAVAVKFEVDAD